MNIIRPAGLLFMILVFAACAKQEQAPGDEEVAAYYDKAATHAGDHEYDKALELLRKGLAKDTLGGFSSRTAQALNRKMTIEAVMGKYFDALASHEMFEQRCRGMLPDDVEAERIRTKAALLAELGEFGGAEKTLKGIASPHLRDSLQLACYQMLAGEPEKAFALYTELSGNADPVVALQAYTGLLELSIDGSFSKAEAPPVYAHRIIGLAGKVVGERSEGNERSEALALRRAAILLELFPAHAKDASYLYFKALSRARAAGDERLAQLLDCESNAVLANNPEAYARTLDYFGRNNMPLARMAALLKQGLGGKTDEGEKIKALKQGLSIYQYQVSPVPGYALAGLVDRSTEMLAELLLNKGRYAEAFESDELRKLFVLKRTSQRAYDSFDLPEEHEQLERDVVRIGRELSALLQRLANCFETGRGYEHHAATIEAINKKRGLFYEKLTEVRAVSPRHAGMLGVAPVTLRTVQQTLGEGQAVLKIIEGEHWSTVFLVQNSSVDVSRRKVNATLYRSRLQLFREHLAMNPGGGSSRIAGDPERRWLTNLLLKPYAGHLRDIGRLMVIAGDPLPAHLLGAHRFLVVDFPVSWIYSANELVQQASLKEGGESHPVFHFYSADSYREALRQKLTLPHHTVFLLWRSFSSSELEELRLILALSLQQGNAPSETLHQLAKQTQPESDQWLYLSEYGIRGQ